MRVEIKLSGIDDVLGLLKSLPPEVVSKRGGPVKTALRKGAKVIQLQELRNLEAVTSNATSAGSRLSTGLIKQNLVVTRGKEPSDGKGERYLVRIRRKSYGRGDATTLKAAQLLEYGSSQQPAEPFIRPAFEAKAAQAIETARAELLRAIDRVVAKLSKRPRNAAPGI